MQWIYLVIAATAVFTLGCLWWVRRAEKARQRTRATGDMLLTRLQDANAKLSAAVASEHAVMAAMSLLPETVGPREALDRLRAEAPDRSEHDYQALMLHGWEVQRRPQALAALAGLALLGKTNMSPMLWRALKDGAAPLLDQIATGIEAGFATIPPTVKTSGLPVTLRDAAARVEVDAPAVADRLRRVADEVTVPIRKQAFDSLLFAIERQEDAGDVDLKTRVGELAKQCWPGFAELGEHVHALIDQHDANEALSAHIWFDKAVLHHFYDAPHGLDGFDAGAAVERLCAGLVSPDAGVSDFSAVQAADLIGDYFFDSPEHHARLQTALDQAVWLHGPSANYDWLDEALSPHQVQAERQRMAEMGVARQGEVMAGVDALVRATSTQDPEVALAELRAILPDMPPDLLRVALTQRWQVDRAPVALVALVGLALEALQAPEVDGKLVQSCLAWPLREGPPEMVAGAVRVLEQHFSRADPWLERQWSIAELERAAARIDEIDRSTAGAVRALAARAAARRASKP
ncbi:MAG: hypothetical protein KIT02_07020 [Devosia sp.]|uniref:hypothetical protein n=1 Tax=Devosia sp. TaxID=1871048 RepID=UPI0024C9FB09|nr:hypothetical protein [Devosia sp.]UYO00946.1 MAG: hypothetical protein KIT02_07020 [Devosia sp.]